MKKYCLLGVVLTLIACQTTSYTFNGVSYSTPAAAIAASDSFNDQIVAAMTESKTPLSSSLKVVLPSPSLTKAKGFITSGPTPGETQLSYLEQIVYSGQHVVVEALRKHNLFKSVNEARSDTPHLSSTDNEDYLLWFQYNETDSAAGWYLKSAKTGNSVPVLFDNMDGGTDAMKSLIEGIEIAVKKLN
ncbi:hypothetical protein [Alteromonas lipolytica]|uniref:Uncharacterized protein n=1 Tax=Alteromonas lipolytica TaxID=1856405 RepID=A0A1E8FH69_9ALTE|nr:hypothetical protein [Alteromonas lipolytica]OFI35269.1 hypothetical protein BFC17_17200 [Alteromonas lipolytica]GGF58132.1 hypothetical protein GCM10011338_08020 [Alteromonas lipolytica]